MICLKDHLNEVEPIKDLPNNALVFKCFINPLMTSFMIRTKLKAEDYLYTAAVEKDMSNLDILYQLYNPKVTLVLPNSFGNLIKKNK